MKEIDKRKIKQMSRKELLKAVSEAEFEKVYTDETWRNIQERLRMKFKGD